LNGPLASVDQQDEDAASLRALPLPVDGAVLVVDDAGSLVGIVTERDFLTRIADQPGLADLPVRDFMTPNPETVLKTDTVAMALGKMNVRGYRHLPIVEGNRPVGMISVRDILRYMAGLFREK
jgi:CBS domain-containing protein